MTLFGVDGRRTEPVKTRKAATGDVEYGYVSLGEDMNNKIEQIPAQIPFNEAQAS